ncbi:hypothetical protein [Phytohabitans rumicis]|nr:hypothetical protein [Phytohabitans rumicis]
MDHYLNPAYAHRDPPAPSLPVHPPAAQPVLVTAAHPAVVPGRPPVAPALAIAGAMVMLVALMGLALVAVATVLARP